jgi:hypothetical protein
MMPIVGTAQVRRRLYLKAAAEAEITAASLADSQAKAASIDLAVSCLMAASEISEYEDGGKRWCSGAPYWMVKR